MNLVERHGVVGLLVLIIVFLFLFPDKVEKFQANILYPLFRWFRLGPKLYISKRVSSTVKEFFNRHLGRPLSTLKSLSIRIKWVTQSEDPILKEDGTIILRMQESDDQTHNLLTAANYVVATTICPTIRQRIAPEIGETIDLAILHRFAQQLGKHAIPIFHKHFLLPKVGEDHLTLLEELIELDNAGVFVTVFLEEIELLGESLMADGDFSDKSQSIREFLGFLLPIARRKEYEEVPLDFIGADFRVSILMLAKNSRAETQGVEPYINRFRKIIRPLRGHHNSSRVGITFYQVGQITAGFEERLVELKLQPGQQTAGKVMDVSRDNVHVDVAGLNGLVRRPEAAWLICEDCREVVSVGEERTFVVRDVDMDRGILLLSLKIPETDPVGDAAPPQLDEEVRGKVVAANEGGLILRTEESWEVYIPMEEVSWDSVPPSPETYMGQSISCKITNSNPGDRSFKGSIRIGEPNPWPAIGKKFPKGTRVRVEVNCIDAKGIVAKFEEEEVYGYISKYVLEAAGHEYAEYRETMVVGQKLHAVVSRVFQGKKKIQLELARNVD